MLGLNKDFLHGILLLVELVVHLVEILKTDTMREHLGRVQLAILNHLQKLLPIFDDRGLTVADEADTALHQGANVEVVGLHSELVRGPDHWEGKGKH